MKIKITLVSILLLSIFLGGCGVNKGANPKENKITVYTTIFPLEDFTKKIGGELVEVKSVYPPNVDAHTFEPSMKTMANMANADLFIYTGAGIEGFAEQAAETLSGEKVKILQAVDGIELLEPVHEEEHGHDDHDEHGHEDESGNHVEEHGDVDPHVWLDPIRSIQMAENIKNTLVELLPEDEKVLEENFSKLKSDLEQLDSEFQDTISQSKNKSLLVAHAAYGYWEERYGIEQIAITGLSPTQEPSQKELKKIIELSESQNIQYIVFEQNVTPKVGEIIKKEIGAKTLTFHNLEALTEENVQDGEDYFSLMRKNLETIKTALND